MALLLVLSLLGGCGEESASTGGLAPNGNDWTFVNYWAQWCKPCIKEIPELNELDTRPGYRVLGVNFDGAVGAELQEQIAALGVAFPTLDADPGGDFDLPRPQVLPTTLVVTPGGALHRVLIGPQTADSLIAATRGPSETGAAPDTGTGSGD